MKTKYYNTIIVLFVVFTSSFLYSKDSTIWIDVRSKQEHKADHIKGDHLISFKNIVKKVKDLYPKKDTPIVLYCKSGGRADIALTALKKAGYQNVHNVHTIENARKLRKLNQ